MHIHMYIYVWYSGFRALFEYNHNITWCFLFVFCWVPCEKCRERRRAEITWLLGVRPRKWGCVRVAFLSLPLVESLLPFLLPWKATTATPPFPSPPLFLQKLVYLSIEVEPPKEMVFLVQLFVVCLWYVCAHACGFSARFAVFLVMFCLRFRRVLVFIFHLPLFTRPPK